MTFFAPVLYTVGWNSHPEGQGDGSAIPKSLTPDISEEGISHVLHNGYEKYDTAVECLYETDKTPGTDIHDYMVIPHGPAVLCSRPA